MLYNIPIESLEERYSADWNIWFPKYYMEHAIPYFNVYPEGAQTVIRDGEFLDVVGTNIFKIKQLEVLLGLLEHRVIKDGDVLFFHDLWFPGLEMLFYIRDALGLDFKIVGILHAGTYDPYDYLTQKGMSSWASFIEQGWFIGVDAIFVGSYFHKNLICKSRGDFENKIHITGLPVLNASQLIINSKETAKENIVVFPHRLAPEKQPEVFYRLKEELEERTGWEFITTKDTCTTKKEYYETLLKSKISFSAAKQETFGIAQREALYCGCIPIQPYSVSYAEFFQRELCYSDESSAFTLVEAAINNPGRYGYTAEHNRQRLLREDSEISIYNMILKMRLQVSV